MLFQAYVHPSDGREGHWREVGDETALRVLAQEWGDAVIQFRVSGLTHTPINPNTAPLYLQIVSRGGATVKEKVKGWGMRTRNTFLCYGTDLDEVLGIRDELIRDVKPPRRRNAAARRRK